MSCSRRKRLTLVRGSCRARVSHRTKSTASVTDGSVDTPQLHASNVENLGKTVKFQGKKPPATKTSSRRKRSPEPPRESELRPVCPQLARPGPEDFLGFLIRKWGPPNCR